MMCARVCVAIGKAGTSVEKAKVWKPMCNRYVLRMEYSVTRSPYMW